MCGLGVAMPTIRAQIYIIRTVSMTLDDPSAAAGAADCEGGRQMARKSRDSGLAATAPPCRYTPLG